LSLTVTKKLVGIVRQIMKSHPSKIVTSPHFFADADGVLRTAQNPAVEWDDYKQEYHRTVPITVKRFTGALV
jgi:hypothetical protein